MLRRLDARAAADPGRRQRGRRALPDRRGVEAQIVDILGRQVASPVQFVKGLQTLYDAGARVFVETGPSARCGASPPTCWETTS